MKEFFLPSSKSIANRLLIIRYLAGSNEEIMNFPKAEDSTLLLSLLQQTYSNPQDTFYCYNAGTTTRFLVSILALKSGVWHIDADKRMKERPIKPLLDVLKSLGAQIIAENNNGLPLTIIGGSLCGGKEVRVDSSLSSQFLSSLLLISPYLHGGLTFILQKETASMPYVEMTLLLMQNCGAKIIKDATSIRVQEGQYTFSATEVENDWASALFAFETLAIRQEGKYILKNLSLNSIQPERNAVKYFALFGVNAIQKDKDVIISYDGEQCSLNNNEKTIDIYIKDCIDSFTPLAASAILLKRKVIFKNINSLRYKESNRVIAMQQGLQSLGANIVVSKNDFIVNGFRNLKENVLIHSFSDHRIAMAFFILGIRIKGLKIDNKDCVVKSFTNFFSNFD